MDSEESYDDCFWRAVKMAEEILRNHFEAVAGIVRAASLVRKAMEESNGSILILPKFVPWKNEVIGSSYQMVVYPSNRGGYSVQGVPIEHGDTALVCAMPEEWRGKDAPELSQISGIASLRFCHASGFLAAADTLEGAVQAAQTAIARKES